MRLFIGTLDDDDRILGELYPLLSGHDEKWLNHDGFSAVACGFDGLGIVARFACTHGFQLLIDYDSPSGTYDVQILDALVVQCLGHGMLDIAARGKDKDLKVDFIKSRRMKVWASERKEEQGGKE